MNCEICNTKEGQNISFNNDGQTFTCDECRKEMDAALKAVNSDFVNIMTGEDQDA